MKKLNYKKTIILGVVAIALPVCAFAQVIAPYWCNYYLGALQSAQMDFEVTDDTLKYHEQNAKVTNLQHDGASSGCTFCKLEVKAQRKGWLSYSTFRTDNISTPNTGSYSVSQYSVNGKGKYRYLIKNNGAYQNDGVFTVTTRDYRV